MDEHVLSKLDGGCCVFEVHSDGAAELMHQSLERLAEKGGTYQFTLPSGGFKIHAKVYFGIHTLGRRVTAVLFGTSHPCMMHMKLVAYPTIASEIMASAVAGSPRTPEQTESLLDMTGGTLSNEEWVEYYAGKLEALETEERRAYDRFLKQHDGDRHEAWQSLIGFKSGFKSWTSLTALKTVAGAAGKKAVASQALSAAMTRREKAARKEELEAAKAEHAAVVEARGRQRDGGSADLQEGEMRADGKTESRGTRIGKARGGAADYAAGEKKAGGGVSKGTERGKGDGGKIGGHCSAFSGGVKGNDGRHMDSANGKFNATRPRKRHWTGNAVHLPAQRVWGNCSTETCKEGMWLEHFDAQDHSVAVAFVHSLAEKKGDEKRCRGPPVGGKRASQGVFRPQTGKTITSDALSRRVSKK